MSIFGNIMSAIFGKGTSQASAAPGPSVGAEAAAAKPSSAGPAVSMPAPSIAPGAAPPSGQQVDVEAVLTERAKQKKEKLNWRTSIVDLMKLLDLDSSQAARKELADELGYTGDKGDSAKMNMWLHKTVLARIAENGGNVPRELLS
jgi:Domain of unknown function (DUF3597)